MIKILNKGTNNKKKEKIYKETCCECFAELEFSDSDVQTDNIGSYIVCPECGNEIEVERSVTIDSITFPDDFDGPRGIDIPNEKIQMWVKTSLKNLRESGERSGYCLHASGNSLVIAMVDDEDYKIYVTKDYYECVIPKNN